MATGPHGPEFIWGDIIKVPHTALCPDGLHPEYGAVYGIVISHKRFWLNYIPDPILRSLRRPGNNERVGQYLVALISEKQVYPGLEIKLHSDGPFKDWYVAAGLLVHVLESQLREMPAPERYRGRLNPIDCQRLQRLLRKLIEYDPDEERGKSGEEEDGPDGRGPVMTALTWLWRQIAGAPRTKNGKSGETAE